jgi:hypothetical protein
LWVVDDLQALESVAEVVARAVAGSLGCGHILDESCELALVRPGIDGHAERQDEDRR